MDLVTALNEYENFINKQIEIIKVPKYGYCDNCNNIVTYSDDYILARFQNRCGY